MRKRQKKISEQGGTKSETSWKMRRKYLGGNNQTNYDTITEERNVIKSESETKQYIAKYFEELYKAREGKAEYAEWTDKIIEKNRKIDIEINSKPHVGKITNQEMNSVIKKLKRNKATGPDGIPNKILVFIEAELETRD